MPHSRCRPVIRCLGCPTVPEGVCPRERQGRYIWTCKLHQMVEASIRSTSPKRRLAERQFRIAPLVEEFGTWLKEQRARVSAKSRLGEKRPTSPGLARPARVLRRRVRRESHPSACPKPQERVVRRPRRRRHLLGPYRLADRTPQDDRRRTLRLPPGNPRSHRFRLSRFPHRRTPAVALPPTLTETQVPRPHRLRPPSMMQALSSNGSVHAVRCFQLRITGACDTIIVAFGKAGGLTVVDQDCLFGRELEARWADRARRAGMPSTQYIGKAGHLAVMGELALRGYNVAMPEIDKGDDIFVVRNDTGAMWRLQVKTSLGTRLRSSKRFQFRIREDSIQNSQNPDLHFVFAMRRKGRWRYLIMDRSVLRNYVINNKLGSPSGEYRQVVITLTDSNVATCSGQDLTNHLSDWNTWPEI